MYDFYSSSLCGLVPHWPRAPSGRGFFYIWRIENEPCLVFYRWLQRLSFGQQRVSASFLENLVIPLPPVSVQKQIMECVAAGREEIDRGRETAIRITSEINAEIEGLILGSKKLSDL